MKLIKYGQLINIVKPARYFNYEINSTHKNFKKQLARIALCFPDGYELGMSNTGLILLYNILNSIEGVVCERVFAPFPDYAELLKKNQIPLTSLESGEELKKFDILGFSFQYEISATNILYILDLAKISLLNCDRREDEPLVICGGPCAVNPEPLKKFIDAFVIGDGEEIITDIVEILKNYKSRAKRLEEISKLTGVYCPELHKSPAFKVKRLIVNDYEKYLKYYQPLIPNIDIVHNRINLEIMRGCTRGCRFCLAGYINRPKRNAAPKIIKEQLFEFVNKTGIRNVTLSSLSSSDYVYIEELLNDILPACNRKKIVLSAPSLRIDTLDKLISFNLNETKKSSLTIAPEAGSHKLRCKINKNLTDEDIEKSLKFAVDRGYQSIKLYFMIGLPEEEDSDILGIVDIAKNLLFYGARKIKKIKLALSVFVPKPHTALQWFALASEQEIKYKIQKICDLLKYRKIEITWHSYKTAVVEALISRGAEQINNVILNAYNNGAKFDDWKEYFNFDYWAAALNKENLEISKLTGKLEVLQKLPWDYVDIGVKKEYLIEEYSNYLKGILREDCSEICHNCSDTFNCSFACPIANTHTIEKIEVTKKIADEDKFCTETVEQYYYRVRFIKSYKIKFISHLDLQKLLITGLSNLQLDFAYTQGYNKKIKIEFIDALALGIIAVDEIMAVTTHKKIDELLFIKKLNEFFKGNIIIKSAELISKKKMALINSVKAFEYNIILNKNSGISAEKIIDYFSGKQEIEYKSKIKILDLDNLIISKKLIGREDYDIINLLIKNVNGSINPYHILKKYITPEFIVDIIRKKVII